MPSKYKAANPREELSLAPIEPLQVLNIIAQVKGTNTLRDRALIATLYLTGSRISEICRYKIYKPELHRSIEKSRGDTDGQRTMGTTTQKTSSRKDRSLFNSGWTKKSKHTNI